MTKQLWCDAHWFSKTVIIVVGSVLLCVIVGLVQLVSCLLLLVLGVALGYHGVIKMIQSHKLFPSSEIFSIAGNWTRSLTSSLSPTVDSSIPAEDRAVPSDDHTLCSDDNSCSQVNMELDVYVKYIMRDFIVRWYRNLSSNDQFIRDLQYTLEDVSVAIVSRARKLCPHTLLRRALVCYHSYFLSYLHALKKADFASNCNSTSSDSHGNGKDIEKYFTGWHYALNSESAEIKHLHNIVSVLLEALVPADILSCGLSRKLVTSILVHNVLHPVINLISDPHWVNSKIALLNDTGTDSRQVCPTSNQKGPSSGSVEESDSGVILESSNSYCAVEHDGQTETEGVTPRHSHSLTKNVSLTGTNDYLVSDTCDITCQSDSETSGDIWQRMAGELPSAFRSEREQEISDLVEEVSSQSKKKSTKIPISTSLEKISDMFYSALSFDYISNNLAQYFKLSSDDDKSDQVSIETNCSENATTPFGASGDFSPVKNSTPKTFNDETNSEASNSAFHVSSGLQRVLPMTTGPILSDRVVNISDYNTSTVSSTEEESVHKVEKSKLELYENSEPSSVNPDVLDCVPDDEAKAHISSETGKINIDPTGCQPSGILFSDIVILSTETVDKGSSGAHVIYCIQYSAWYEDSHFTTSVDDDYVDIEPRMMLQKNYVWRRFREFLALHKTLEEDPKLRFTMKGIKEPNRWLVLPFNKLDKEAIEDRKQALENYLKVLMSKEDIAESKHLREFLAYDVDPRIAYVRKGTDLSVPRIDKLLLKTVTGVFDKLKTALPSLPHDPSPVEGPGNLQKTSDRLRGLLNFTSTVEEKCDIGLNIIFTSENETTNSIVDQLSSFLGSHEFSCEKIDVAYDAVEMETLRLKAKNSVSNLLMNHTIQQSVAPFCDKNEFESEEIPFLNAILNFLVDTIVNERRKRNYEFLIHGLKIFLGQGLERWLCQFIDVYTSDAMLSKYVRNIRESIWPNGILWTHSTNFEIESDRKDSYHLALQALKDCFPSIIAATLGKAQCEDGITLFLNSFQHPKLLRHLIFQLLDLVVDAILKRSRSRSIIEKLGSLT